MKGTFKNLKAVYNYGKKYRLSLILQAIGSLLAIIFNIILPILSAKLIAGITENAYIQIITISVVILIVNVIGNLKTIMIRKNTQKFFRGVTESIQKDISKEILRIEQSDLDRTSSGIFIQRMTSDTDKLAGIFTMGMGDLAGVIASIGVFISIFIISKECFIFYVIVSTILTLLHNKKSSIISKKYKIEKKQNDKVSGTISELVRGARDIKMLNAKKSFLSNLNYNIKLQNDYHIDVRNVDIKYNCIIGLINTFFEFVLILLLVHLISNGKVTVALALALYSYRQQIMKNMMDNISRLFEELVDFNVACDRIFSILYSDEFKKESFGKKHLSNVCGDFEFNDVVFGYDDSKNILDGLSFKINSNETIGFVGKSGEGKTTIFNLLCKMYDINSGSIKIDGVDIKDLDEDSIRGNITIIGQNPYIFNESIKNNLKLVKEDLTDEEMKEACRVACLEEFIESLPNKYDTVVGEGGVTLSGGQKQRLAIARAFVQKTKIILFDEATSALDNETQYKIKKAINNLRDDYTILIIAHRLSTVVDCDRIMVLNNGVIEDQGTHDELLVKNDIYKKMCSIDFNE